MLVNPNVTFSVDFSEGIKVQLTNQRLEPVVTEVLRQSFGLQPFDIRPNDKSISFGRPLKNRKEEFSEQTDKM